MATHGLAVMSSAEGGESLSSLSVASVSLVLCLRSVWLRGVHLRGRVSREYIGRRTRHLPTINTRELWRLFICSRESSRQLENSRVTKQVQIDHQMVGSFRFLISVEIFFKVKAVDTFFVFVLDVCCYTRKN